MKLSFIVSVIAAGFAFSSVSRATVTFATSGAGVILDSSGSMISLDSIGILLADTANDGVFDPFGTVLSVGNTFGNGGEDLILGVYGAVDLGSGQNGFDFTGTEFTYSGNFQPGVNLWLVWFPTISTEGSTVIAGTSYGTFRTESIDVNGTINWTSPSDGSNPQLVSYSSALGGDPAVSPSDFTANFTAVPEPSVAALIGVAATAGMLIFRRRRHA